MKNIALWQWILGVVIFPLLGFLVGRIIKKKDRKNNEHKDTHQDLYDELKNLKDLKADKDFVIDEIKKINQNVNSKIDEHVRESVIASQMMIELIQTQKGLITSIDENVKIVLKTMIQK